MKRVLTVVGTALAVVAASGSGAWAAWSASGTGTGAGAAASFKTPSLNGNTGPGRTTCGNNKKITAKWSLPTGGQAPTSFVLTVGGTADPISISGTAREATSANTYSGSQSVTITAHLGAWNETSNAVTVTC